MPSIRSTAFALLTCLSVVGMAACAPTPTMRASARSSPTTTSHFENEREALDAATKTINEFFRVATEVLVEEGVGGERLNEFATPSVVAHEMTGFEELRLKELVYRGRTTMKSVVMQSYLPESVDGVGIVTVYACTDVTDVSIEYPDGESYVSADRPDLVPFEIALDLTSSNSTSLVVSSKLYWEGDGIC